MLSRNLGEVYKKGLFFMSDLYSRIEDLCKAKNQTITTMCKESGASRASLSDLKMGRKQTLSADTLSKIARHFSVSVDYLLNGFDNSFCAPDTENPYELELRDTFDTLDADNQIYVKDWVNEFAKDPEKAKKAPTENGERDILDEVDIAFYSGYKELDETDKEVLRDMVQLMRQRRANNNNG